MATTTKAKVKVIEREYFNGRQSVEFKGIYEYKGHKLRVTIDIDSYDSQSSARINVFNPQKLEWNFLESIPYSRMESVKNKKVHCYRPVDELRFSEKQAIQKDIDELLKKAKQIL